MRPSGAHRMMLVSRGPTLTATKSGDASASATSSSSQTLTTNSVTINASGGISPLSYSWTRISGSFTINHPTLATTDFTEMIASGATDAGVARCTISSLDGQSTTVDVNVSLAVAAPQPPVWNVANGANLGTWTRGTPKSVALFATAPNPGHQVTYSIGADFAWGSGNSGPEPTWPTGVQTADGTGNLSGTASAGVAPGNYSATLSAVNPADGSSSTISVTVTVA